jgi:phosphatidylserine decarboxylase
LAGNSDDGTGLRTVVVAIRTGLAGTARVLYVGLQYALPQHLLSRTVFTLGRLRLGAVTEVAIRLFIRAFDVDMGEAADPDPGAYPSFNAFFTRRLRDGLRPVSRAPDALVSPVDGALSRFGRIEAGRVIQAKGRDFGCAELLGGDAELAGPFEGGAFATLYLAPGDYHRIHMPLDGALRSIIHVPGRLFSVNPTTTAAVPRLYARNERAVCLFETAIGPVAMVLVGAIFVGGIETVPSGPITPPRGRAISRIDFEPGRNRLCRGDELGRFNLGSTVVLVLPGRVHWDPALREGMRLRCGEPLAKAPGGPPQ